MDKVIELAKALKSELNSLPLFQEYKRLRQEIDNSIEIKELKKQIVRAKNENRLDDHKRLLNQYESHPLIMNYKSIEEEVTNYLKEITEILNKEVI